MIGSDDNNGTSNPTKLLQMFFHDYTRKLIGVVAVSWSIRNAQKGSLPLQHYCNKYFNARMELKECKILRVHVPSVASVVLLTLLGPLLELLRCLWLIQRVDAPLGQLKKKTLEKRFFSEHQIILLCCHSVNRYLREESRVCEMTASDMSKRTTEQSASVEYNTQRPRNTALYVRPNGICFVEKASNKLPICKVAELSWMQWVCRIICSKAEYNRRFYCKT